MFANLVKSTNFHPNDHLPRCTECDRSYCSVRELNKHIQRHSEAANRKVKSLPCDICLKLFASKPSLDRHKQRHDDRKKSEEGQQHDKFIADNFDMTCDRCDAVFSAFHDARRHYKESHGDEKGYIKCCNVKLRELWLVRDHIKSHLNPESFKWVFWNTQIHLLNSFHLEQKLMIRFINLPADAMYAVSISQLE